MSKKILWTLGAILACMVAFLVYGYLSIPAHAVEEIISCEDVYAPDPISFESNVAKHGTINASYKWFEDSEGVWTLKLDIDPQGGENHQNWVNTYPSWWEGLLSRPVTLPQTVTEVVCPTPTPEATPSASIAPESSVQVAVNSPSCSDIAPTKTMANFHVIRLGLIAFVKWFPTEGDKAHIYYKESASGGWQHSASDIPNNGFAVIGWLTNPNYTFAGQQVSGCAVGPLTNEVKTTNGHIGDLFR